MNTNPPETLVFAVVLHTKENNVRIKIGDTNPLGSPYVAQNILNSVFCSMVYIFLETNTSEHIIKWVFISNKPLLSAVLDIRAWAFVVVCKTIGSLFYN